MRVVECCLFLFETSIHTIVISDIAHPCVIAREESRLGVVVHWLHCDVEPWILRHEVE